MTDFEGRQIGPYRIVARIGAGGMGEVFKAHDAKLDRVVALKLLPSGVAGDPDRLRRFHAEARAASSLNHPHILVVHDFGELQGRPFIVTEFVEGQTLRPLIQQGPVPTADALRIATQIASALAAAHARGVVHRDIKPENVMVRPDGYVKVLDFGIAKLLDAAVETGDQTTMLAATEAGVIVGSPRYMSPEQTRGLPVDRRTDVWSLGVLLYELLEGHPPFDGRTAADVAAAILRANVPETTRTPKMVSDFVFRALSKDAGDRFASGQQMLEALREFDQGAGRRAAATPAAGPLRLIVLPFRILRSDSDTDFLAFSLPDALAASLANLDSIAVRSSLAAGRLAADADLKTIAAASDVDVVLSGTMLRAGNELRVTAQLVEVETGTLTWSHTAQSPLGDIFRLQDSLVDRIVESLSLPLTARERRLLKHDEPASAVAYEFYLRANQVVNGAGARLWTDRDTRALALNLYRRSIDADANYAPVWAALGRVHRVASRYDVEEMRENADLAAAAVKRALELNPNLPAAHTLHAMLDLDAGRGREALVRLLERARHRTGDPELFAALCQVCRYSGLLDGSLQAHERALQLDSKIRTSSGVHTLFIRGEYSRVIEFVLQEWRSHAYIGLASLAALGRFDEAIEAARAKQGELSASSRLRSMVLSLTALLEGDRAQSIRSCAEATADA